MSVSPTIFQGEFSVPRIVQEAAERALTISMPADVDDTVNTSFGSGRVSLYDIQPGLRCELNAMDCHTDCDFEFLGGPFVTCNITLDGKVSPLIIDGYGKLDQALQQATLNGFSEPTRWVREVRAGQSFRSFGFTLLPEFFDKFAGAVESEHLAVLKPFREELKISQLPKSQRLIDLAQNAFEHPYSGGLAALYQESNTLQFVLEVVNLLHEKSKLEKQLGQNHYDRLMHARHILDENLIAPPKTLDLASEVGSNVNTLQAHFKLAYGVTIFGYIRMRRLEMARVLITEHKLGSAQAGYRVGFSNPAAFTAAYRKYFGHPPSAEK